MLIACAGLGLADRGVAWQLASRRARNITLTLALARPRARRARTTGIARLDRSAGSNAAGFGTGLTLSCTPAVAANAVDTEAERALAVTRAAGARGRAGAAARAAPTRAGTRATRARHRGIHGGRAAGVASIHATRASVRQRGRATSTTGCGDYSARAASRGDDSASATASRGLIELAVQRG